MRVSQFSVKLHDFVTYVYLGQELDLGVTLWKEGTSKITSLYTTSVSVCYQVVH
jgi:hypothetical protein